MKPCTVLVVFLVVELGCFAGSIPSGKKKLIYILLDGFRYDYIDDQPTSSIPGFSKFVREGVRAEYMTPIFPSISYPAWTTLVTGLHPESHGIVGNYFYDPQERDDFSLLDSNSTEKEKWWTAEPIWATASKAGLKTAVILMSRCDIAFDGVVPDYCEPFLQIREGHQIFRESVEKALHKLQQGFDFIMVYNGHIDNIGHEKGPETEERKQGVRDLDSTVDYMFRKLDEIGMTDQVNIIVVSDHGMTSTTPDAVQRVEMDDYLLTDYVERVSDAGAFSNIKVKEGHVDKVYQKLAEMPGVNVFKHTDIPGNLHYKNNKYIHDIVLNAHINTWILMSRTSIQFPSRDDSYVVNGAHGFDPVEENMRAIFLAYGPDFKAGERIGGIKSVDVYPLLAHLLRVKPQPNNGTFSAVKMALKDDHHHSSSENSAISFKCQLCSLSVPFFYFLHYIFN